jgi:hypothetical protein
MPEEATTGIDSISARTFTKKILPDFGLTGKISGHLKQPRKTDMGYSLSLLNTGTAKLTTRERVLCHFGGMFKEAAPKFKAGPYAPGLGRRYRHVK